MTKSLSIDSNKQKQSITILMNADEKRELRIENSRRKRFSKISYRSMTFKTNNLFDRIYNAFDLKPDIVKNIIAYARSLPRQGTEEIDANIFNAQMKRHFNLTDWVLLERIYSVCCIDERNKMVTLNEYIELICIFLTEIRDLKIQFVFKVYNTRGDGFLSKQDLEYFVKHMVSQMAKFSVDDDDYDGKEAFHFFVKHLTSQFQMDDNKKVGIDALRNLTKRNVAMMQCLGPCLPSENDKHKFLRSLSNKTVLEISAYFRHERRISLFGINKSKDLGGIQKYYPVPLELP